MHASLLWTQTLRTDSSTYPEGTRKLPSGENPNPTETILLDLTLCPRSCAWRPSQVAPTTGRSTGVGRGLPWVSPTKASKGPVTGIAVASATTASLGASFALTPATLHATTRTRSRSTHHTLLESGSSWTTVGELCLFTLSGKQCLSFTALRLHSVRLSTQASGFGTSQPSHSSSSD